MIAKIVIIEDEKPNADRLRRLLKVLYPEAEILAVLDCIADSVKWFSYHPQPDVVLMDVRLSDGLSFEIFDMVNIVVPVIFTTAYDEYALRAFKHNGIDYLLKPIESDELKAALAKVESNQLSVMQNVSLGSVLELFKPKEYRKRFLLPFRDGYKTVLLEDVAFFYSELKITRAKLRGGEEEIVPQTMEELEQQLDPKLFFRANRQFIVHVDAIVRIHNYFNGKLKLEIKKNPTLEVVVSRDKAMLLKNWLDF